MPNLNQQTTRPSSHQSSCDALLETCAPPLTILDRSGNIVAANSAFRQLGRDSGLFPPDPIGANYLQCLDAASNTNQLSAHLQEVLDGRRPELTHEFCCAIGGRKRWFLVTAAFPQEAERTNSGVAVWHFDVTRRKLRKHAMRAHARQQAGIAELGQRALGHQSFTSVIHAAVEFVADTLNSHQIEVLQRQENEGPLRRLAGVGWQGSWAGEELVPQRFDEPARFVLDHGRPLVVRDLASDPRFSSNTRLRQHGVAGAICVPVGRLESQKMVLAVYLGGHYRSSRRQLRCLQSVASLLAMAQERDRSEKSRQRLLEILQATSDLVGCADRTGRALYLNPAGRRMLGLDADEDLSNLTISDFHSERVSEVLHDELLPAAIRNGSCTSQTALRTRDGREIPVSQVILAHRDRAGELEFFSTIARDVSHELRIGRRLSQICASEQQRIGKELHDTTCQELVALQFLATTLERKLEAGSQRSAASDLVAGLDRVGRQVRSLVQGLLPREINAGDLATALRKLTIATEQRFGIACRLEYREEQLVPDNTVATELFFIASEAIHNAVKHSEASKIDVELEVTKSLLSLSVVDDGIGYDADAVAPESSEGMGHQIMQYRARLVGGVLQIQTAVGHGTAVRFFRKFSSLPPTRAADAARR